MKRLFPTLVLITLTMLGLVACGDPPLTPTPAVSSPTAAPAPAAARADIHIAVVTHGQITADDPFWLVVKNGVTQAAKDMGVTVTYQAPDTFDMAAMAKLIDAAIATKPDGLVVSLPDANALGPAVRRAIAAGIPVISINSGGDDSKRLGVLTHVGPTDYESGRGAGEKMAAAGIKSALCVNQEVGNAGLDARCQGFTDAMQKAGGKVQLLAVDAANTAEGVERVKAAIDANPNIDGVMDPPRGTRDMLRAAGKLGTAVKLATFDFTPGILDAIKKGDILFAVDQQQYLQGYMPIVLLTLYKTNGNTIANPVLLTGPGFINKDNVDQVLDLVGKGTR